MIQPPRQLSKDDPINEFDCGEPSLNRWLKENALKSRASRDAITYVVTNHEGRIAGFYSLVMCSMMRDDVGVGRFTRNSPNPIPCVLLARLAVATWAQKTGLGADLLSDAIARASVASEIVGARILIVDAIDRNAYEFYLHHEFTPLDSSNRLAHRLG